MPDIALDLNVTNGLISYPALPEQIKNINFKSDIFVDGKDMDKTTVRYSRIPYGTGRESFRYELLLKTPMSDPDFRVQ